MATTVFNPNNFIIQRPLRGLMFEMGSNWKYMWGVNQLTDATLSLGSTPVTLTSATGATIAEMDRVKYAAA